VYLNIYFISPVYIQINNNKYLMDISEQATGKEFKGEGGEAQENI